MRAIEDEFVDWLVDWNPAPPDNNMAVAGVDIVRRAVEITSAQ